MGNAMTIYNFNLLIGYVSTGVDYAQAYRAQILDTVCDQKYIFLDVPQYRELEYYSRIGISQDQILALPFWFAGARNIFPSLPYEVVKEKIIPDKTEYSFIDDEKVKSFCEPEPGKSIIFHLTDEGFVYMVEYYFKNTLIRKDHYSDRLLFSEYMMVQKDSSKAYVSVCQIDYYDQEGNTCLKEYRTKEGRIYSLPDLSRYTTIQLLEKYLCLNTFSDSDVFLLDRTSPHLQVLLKNKGNAKMVFFMHSKLTFSDYSDSHHWKGINYEYSDLVRSAAQFDAILVSTEEQADEVQNWFFNEYGIYVNTCAIPAGGMKDLSFPTEQRKRHGLVTVSRLDHRKRIDLLIRTIVEARKSIPDLTLDIYGEGPAKEKYAAIISEYGAEEFVSLKGYIPNFDKYAQYEGYISASLWETFGLTLLEAMSGGLPLIGLDVPYGNRCFICDGRNGFLVPYENGQSDETTVNGLAAAIQKLYEKDDLSVFSLYSYSEAAKYTIQEIRKKWVRLLKEIGVRDIDCITG